MRAPQRPWLAGLVLLISGLPGCALLQSPAPPSASPSASTLCAEQDQQIGRLQQALAQKDAEIQQLRAKQNLQAQALEQTTGEVARAKVKLRRLATHAEAASQLAETEVTLQRLRSTQQSERADEQLARIQRILDAGAAAFAQGDYGVAVGLTAQAQELIGMLESRTAVAATQDTVEVPFQIPVMLRARADTNLRARPLSSAALLEVLPQGTVMQVHAYRGEWLQVRTDEGRTGWIFGPLLEAPYPAAK
ncbi:MAG: SH3 domain-containing protein [Chromatocurvus sp.]